MKKAIEDLLRHYWYEGFMYVLISTDNEIFVTKFLNGYGFSKEELFKKSTEEVAYLPIEELKNLFDKENRSTSINYLIDLVDWEAVEVDTPVIVRRRGTSIVLRRYFKEYNPTTKRVAVFNRGCTSWSNDCGCPDYFDVDEVYLA